jgi:hypothetical protein
MDFTRIWLPFIYLYGVGGFIFFIGIYIILKSKSLKTERLYHRKWLFILIFGFFYYLTIHGLLTLAALDNYLFVIIFAVGFILLAVVGKYIIVSSKGIKL